MKNEDQIRFLRDKLLETYNKPKGPRLCWYSDIEALSWVLNENNDWGVARNIKEYLDNQKK